MRVGQQAGDLEAMARALEGQAELVAEVLGDVERGEEIGVPSFIRNAAYAAEAWMRAAEIKRRLGDLDGAAARSLIDAGAIGSNAAALWLRVAEAAALTSDRVGALDALRHALEADPGAIPARAIELDLLVDGQDPAALAGAIEGAAATFVTEAAKARAFLLAAYVWGCVARDARAAETALERAGNLGVPAASLLRVARLLASVAGDAGAFGHG